jgi:peptidoglycan hydrolase CwlO-like protein
MNEIEERKVQCFDLLRKIEAANAKVKEWQAEVQRLASEINQLEVTDGSA